MQKKDYLKRAKSFLCYHNEIILSCLLIVIIVVIGVTYFLFADIDNILNTEISSKKTTEALNAVPVSNYPCEVLKEAILKDWSYCYDTNKFGYDIQCINSVSHSRIYDIAKEKGCDI